LDALSRRGGLEARPVSSSLTELSTWLSSRSVERTIQFSRTEGRLPFRRWGR